MKDMALESRVEEFQSCRMPGQPIGMHMGTFYLVMDLKREIERLEEELAKCAEQDHLGNSQQGNGDKR